MYTQNAYTSTEYTAAGEEAAPAVPILLPSIPVEIELYGTYKLIDVHALQPIFPGVISISLDMNAAEAVPQPYQLGPIRPGTIGLVPWAIGPWIIPLPPTDPLAPVIPVGQSFVPTTMQVFSGETDLLVKAASAQPAMNATGSGSFTSVYPPDPDELVFFTVLGRTVFSGVPGTIDHHVVASGEESAQLYDTTVVGALDEWRDAVVLPDFGAYDPRLLGSPVQDTRVFDWTMNNGLDTSVDITGSSLSRDAVEAALDPDYTKAFPLPDVWPDPWARWMWVTAPGGAAKGWCCFRVPIPVVNRPVTWWLCAYDYAECWVDGVPLLVCDQPGVSQHIELDATNHYHLVTIRAYNAGGKAGVMFTAMPLSSSGGIVEDAIMNSRSGWTASAYKNPAVHTVGHVMIRLLSEAHARGALLDWSLNGVTKDNDSAGKPWPKLTEPITVEVGSTYLDVLNQFAEGMVDYVVSPGGRSVSMYNKSGSSQSDVGIPWNPGVDLLSYDESRFVR